MIYIEVNFTFLREKKKQNTTTAQIYSKLWIGFHKTK